MCSQMKQRYFSRSQLTWIALLLVLGLAFTAGYLIYERYRSGTAEQTANYSAVLGRQEEKTQPQGEEPSVSRQQSGSSPYLIDVSVGEQKVRIYHHGVLIKEWVASTGKDNSTPLGRFTIQNRGDWFFSEKYQQGARWWVAFKGNYLFHSVPMDREGRLILEEAKKLGKPVSHGCIRLSVEHAKWIYDHIPRGTPVIIHH